MNIINKIDNLLSEIDSVSNNSKSHHCINDSYSDTDIYMDDSEARTDLFENDSETESTVLSYTTKSKHNFICNKPNKYDKKKYKNKKIPITHDELYYLTKDQLVVLANAIIYGFKYDSNPEHAEKERKLFIKKYGIIKLPSDWTIEQLICFILKFDPILKL